MSMQFDENSSYLMPVFFGHDWVARQPWPGGKNKADYYEPGIIHVTSATFETDDEILESMIPPCYKLAEPYMNVSVCEFTNLGYMNGKSYSLINFNVPVTFDGKRDHVRGDLIMAMYENWTDPIIGGRDTNGYAKLYCDIPPVQNVGSRHIATAHNAAFDFMELIVDTDKSAADAEKIKSLETASQGKMNYKYIPAVKEKDEPASANHTKPDASYPVFIPKWVKPDDYPYDIMKPDFKFGDATIRLNAPKWEDWPNFGYVAAGLASLPIKRVLGGKHGTYNDPTYYSSAYRLR